MELINLNKKNRPSVSLEFLSRIGVGFDYPGDADIGLRAYLERLAFAAGVNHIVQVNDCEDDGGYAESADGVFDLEAFGATAKRVGVNCLKMTNSAATNNTQYIKTTYINESAPVPDYMGKRQMDWRDTRYLGFWMEANSSGDFGTAGELLFAIVNDGVLQSKVALQATVVTAHQWVEIDMEAEGWSYNKVEEIRFYSNTLSTGESVHIDDILRYQISYNKAPFYGCAFPIKSAVVVADGNNVGWSADGLILGSATEAHTDLGMAKLFATTLTGTAKRDKWAMIPGICIFIARASTTTSEGEGLIFSALGKVEGVSDGVEEMAHAKGLEVAGESNDDIFCVRGLDNHFIS